MIRILQKEKGTVFVFVNAKEKTFQLSRNLINKGITDVTYIHSDLQQEHRELAVSDFKSGKFRIIIATDVMGRGIDVDDVAHVINYDVPKEAADYIHRIGRTGRRGLTGFASTFAIPGKDDKAIAAIAKLRGVQAPPKDQPRQEPRQDRRPERKHDRHPKSEARPPRRDVKPEARKEATQPAPVAAAPQVKPGLMERIKGFFKGFSK